MSSKGKIAQLKLKEQRCQRNQPAWVHFISRKNGNIPRLIYCRTTLSCPLTGRGILRWVLASEPDSPLHSHTVQHCLDNCLRLGKASLLPTHSANEMQNQLHCRWSERIWDPGVLLTLSWGYREQFHYQPITHLGLRVTVLTDPISAGLQYTELHLQPGFPQGYAHCDLLDFRWWWCLFEIVLFEQ